MTDPLEQERETMSEKQVTVKSMMLDFAAKLRKDGLDSVSLEFFERIANKEVDTLEADANALLAVRDVLVRIRGWDMLHEISDLSDAPYWRDEIDKALAALPKHLRAGERR